MGSLKYKVKQLFFEKNVSGIFDRTGINLKELLQTHHGYK